jgi:hypothetical protein
MALFSQSCKHSIALLCITAMLLPVVGCGGASSEAPKAITTEDGITRKKVEENEAIRRKMETMIANVEKVLQVNPDGTLSLPSNTTRGASRLTNEELAFANAAISGLNKDVKDGKIRVESDLSIKELDVTRANERYGPVSRWWGYEWARTSGDVNRYIALLGVAGGVATIAGALGAGPVGAAVAASLFGIGASVLAYYNADGYGIYIKQNRWVGFTWLESQRR